MLQQATPPKDHHSASSAFFGARGVQRQQLGTSVPTKGRDVSLCQLSLLAFTSAACTRSVYRRSSRALPKTSVLAVVRDSEEKPAAASAAAEGLPRARFSSQFVRVRGVEVHVRDSGDVSPETTQASQSPVVVFLHGFAGSTESWLDVAPALAEAGIRSIAFDRVGFGRTERPEPPSLPAPPAPPKGPLLDALLQAAEGAPDVVSPIGPFKMSAALRRILTRPQTLSPRLPWRLSALGEDPYTSDFQVELLADLLQLCLGSQSSRPIFLVGHSAGCPIALRAAAQWAKQNADIQSRLAGIMLIAPAVLNPREDADLFGGATNNLLQSLQERLQLEGRIALFRLLVDAPVDAVSLPIALRMSERDLNEAVLEQMHPRMREPELESRVKELVQKYKGPLEEFPDSWDAALLNIYRVRDENGKGPKPGRDLIAGAKSGLRAKRVKVVTGDVDAVVSPDASARVAKLLGAAEPTTMRDTGHLPMDERPEELARIIADFVKGSSV
eukprot:TRINITY_DN92200_c0_g1_i1.p1 TRINITY_DN92200_c0_g1~~TRINITY_DN92200_c0_g1_i1.p1  ORF type:complete len:500 (-),score=73.15 TRINITY_DN92200_c0_g1_i1:327-1826(-)